MFAEEKEPAPVFSIIAVKPSRIKRSDFDRLGLSKLVTVGYGYPENAQNLDELLASEYGGEDHRREIFLAVADGNAIGSLTMGLWLPEEIKRGKPFWEYIQNHDPQLAQKAYSYSSLACDMVGIVTLPEYRQHKVARKLYESAITKLNPSIVVGQTKTPEAVMARSRVLSGFGYLTFYGRFNVTTDQQGSNSAIDTILHAYPFTHGDDIDEAGHLLIDTNVLLPTIPDVSNFPRNIQESFADIIEKQMLIGSLKTVAKPLISIKKEILEND